jgi:site-specific DNA-methyltransferase (adenine-specific)
MELYNMDCLIGMKKIKDKSIDFILTDLPYGKTNLSWDNLIDENKLFFEYNRIIKDNGAICLFSYEPYASKLRLANIKYYKYDLIWCKAKATNHLNCEIQPMRKFEKILIFYKKQCIYNPQISDKKPENIRKDTTNRKNVGTYNNINKTTRRKISIDKTYPIDLLFFNECNGVKGKPKDITVKPNNLLKYLINTYTNKYDIILDSCFGIGSTAIACKETNRNFIGFEINTNFYNIAKERINNYAKYRK